MCTVFLYPNPLSPKTSLAVKGWQGSAAWKCQRTGVLCWTVMNAAAKAQMHPLRDSVLSCSKRSLKDLGSADWGSADSTPVPPANRDAGPQEWWDQAAVRKAHLFAGRWASCRLFGHSCFFHWDLPFSLLLLLFHKMTDFSTAAVSQVKVRWITDRPQKSSPEKATTLHLLMYPHIQSELAWLLLKAQHAVTHCLVLSVGLSTMFSKQTLPTLL